MTRSDFTPHPNRIHRPAVSPPGSTTRPKDEEAPARIRRGLREARTHWGALFLAAAISLPTVWVLTTLVVQLCAGP